MKKFVFTKNIPESIAQCEEHNCDECIFHIDNLASSNCKTRQRLIKIEAMIQSVRRLDE